MALLTEVPVSILGTMPLEMLSLALIVTNIRYSCSGVFHHLFIITGQENLQGHRKVGPPATK